MACRDWSSGILHVHCLIITRHEEVCDRNDVGVGVSRGHYLGIDSARTGTLAEMQLNMNDTKCDATLHYTRLEQEQ